MDWIISRLADTGRSLSSLRKEPFNSGQPELDRYLKQFAKKNDETGFSRTFVALSSEGNQMIAGYYSCSASMLDRNELPDDLRARLPNYPPPALLMGKLAVDRSVRGRGLGKRLLYHAFENAIALSQNLGIYAVTVDAIDEEAKRFYKKYGFLEYQNIPLSLFLPIATIKQSMNV